MIIGKNFYRFLDWFLKIVAFEFVAYAWYIGSYGKYILFLDLQWVILNRFVTKAFDIWEYYGFYIFMPFLIYCLVWVLPIATTLILENAKSHNNILKDIVAAIKLDNKLISYLSRYKSCKFSWANPDPKLLLDYVHCLILWNFYTVRHWTVYIFVVCRFFEVTMPYLLLFGIVFWITISGSITMYFKLDTAVADIIANSTNEERYSYTERAQMFVLKKFFFISFFNFCFSILLSRDFCDLYYVGGIKDGEGTTFYSGYLAITLDCMDGIITADQAFKEFCNLFLNYDFKYTAQRRVDASNKALHEARIERWLKKNKDDAVEIEIDFEDDDTNE